jgi:tRNA U54 and U55 pseudouridine synthase Pus10
MAHLTERHWRQWNCPFGCDQSYNLGQDLRDHLEHAHPRMVSNDQLEVFVSACERKSNWKTKNCPLCQESLETQKEFEKHVGLHLEDIALFTLRDDAEGDADSSTEDDSHNAKAPSLQSSESDHLQMDDLQEFVGPLYDTTFLQMYNPTL